MQTRKIVFNTAAQLLGRIVSATAAFLSTVILARLLGAGYYGEYIKVTSFITFFYMAIDFGMNAVFLREYSGAKMKQTFAYFLGLRIVMGAFMALIAMVSVWFISLVNPGFSAIVVLGVSLVSLSLITYSLFLTSNALFQAHLKYDKGAVATNIGAILSLCGIVILMFFPLVNPLTTLFAAFGILVVGTSVSGLTALFLVRPLAQTVRPLLSWNFNRSLLRQSLPLGLVLLSNVVYFRLDMLILSFWRTSAEIGAYGLAYKFFEFAIAVPTFAMNSLYPILLNYPRSQLSRLIHKVQIWLLGGSIVGAIALWIAAPFLVLVKADFASSIVLLRILSLSLPVFYLSAPIMWLYIIRRKQAALVLVYGVGFLVNAGANLLFIPRYGVLAAAIITGVSELVVLLVGTIGLARRSNDYEL